MARIPVTINGVAPSVRFGLRPQSFGGAWDAPTISEQEGGIPGRAGMGIDSDQPTIAPRDLSVEWGMRPAASEAALLAALAGIKALVTRGTLEVVVGDRATRAFFARVRGHSLTRTEPQLLSLALQGSLTLRCLDPYAYDLAPQMRACGAAPTALPQGTAPTWPLLRLTAITNPTVITLRDAAGTTLATMTIAAALNPATEYLDIDMAKQSLTKYTSGVASDAYSALSAGDFFSLPAQDPMGGAPTLAISTGSALAIYRKAHL